MKTKTASSYFPALDGLRGLMALGVIFAHVNLSWFPGAQSMMDVFFIMSAFLISSLLCRTLSRYGNIDLKQFWGRRLKRLYPLLLIVTTTYVVLAIFIVDDLDAILKDYLVSALYVSNFFKLENYSLPTIFSHSWSLSIEEQFYLVCPVVFFAFARFKIKSLTLVGVLTAVVVMIFVWKNYLLYGSVPFERIYYGSDTRIDAFVIGALLGIFWHHRNVEILTCKLVSRLLFISVPALFVCIIVSRPLESYYFSWHQTIIMLLSCAVIICLSLPYQNLFQRFFSLRPLVWLGERCYGLYLWHFPMIWLLNYSQVDLGKFSLLMFVLCVTLILSALSYRFVEEPVLYGRDRSKRDYLSSSPQTESSPQLTNH